jgi:glycosyltransferase involved in cell wall biosynthesis/8-oxo-dGTP pyrophosphatase MutT (NUDIX family)
MKTQFPTFYWGKNTEVKFEPFEKIPKDIPATSCMVMAILNGEYLVLSSPERGWGLPGGHVEEGETPVETALRELREEAAVAIDKDSLQVVGGWLAKKIHKTEKNSKYPDLAYQLLFIANISEVRQFSMRFEIYDRIFVPIGEVLNYATGVNFKPIFEYVTEKYKDQFVIKKHEDKVSIIVPFLNTEKYIKKCLDSISKQSYKNIEVLLIDDGSTDNSQRICEAFAKTDDRFKIITLKRNSGPGHARNTGLDFITGNYVCFIDSDDYVDKEYISKLLSESLIHNADIVECQNYCVIDGKLTSKYDDRDYQSSKIVSKGKEVLSNYLRHESPRISTSSVCNKLYKADLFKNNHIAFDPKLSRFEDSDIMYRLYDKVEKHVYLTEKLYYHVHRKNSIMRSLENSKDGFEDTSYIITKMLAYFANNKDHYSDAIAYLRWNLTSSIQGLSDESLEKFIEDRIIKQSSKLKALYKKHTELLSNDS